MRWPRTHGHHRPTQCARKQTRLDTLKSPPPPPPNPPHTQVVRFGNAIEHAGFAADVGARSDLRFVYHTTAPSGRVSPHEKLMHLITRLPEDLASFQRLSAAWAGEETSVLMVSPFFVDALRRSLVWPHREEGDNTTETSLFEQERRRVERPWPSTGLIALAWARQHCRTVDTYGFGGGQPQGAWHYFDTPETIRRTADHDWSAEEEVRALLEESGFLHQHFPVSDSHGMLDVDSVAAHWAPVYHAHMQSNCVALAWQDEDSGRGDYCRGSHGLSPQEFDEFIAGRFDVA